MPQKKPTVYEFIPKLGQLRDDVLFGDVWEHPDLSKRDRSLITVAMLAALYRTDEMRGHMQRALDNGVTETELKGLTTQRYIPRGTEEPPDGDHRFPGSLL